MDFAFLNMPTNQPAVSRRKMLRHSLQWALAIHGGDFLTASMAFAGNQSKMTTLNRPLPLISELVLSVTADYVIRSASMAQLRITGEARVVDMIAANLTGKVLKIESKGAFSTQQKLLIELDLPMLARLEVDAPADLVLESLQGNRLAVKVTGAADLSLKNLNLNAFVLDIEGSATIEAIGHTIEQKVGIQGTGTYKAENLVCDSARVVIDGAGDADVWARRRLDIKVAGSGTVRYKGSPVIHQQLDGAGSIEKLE